MSLLKRFGDMVSNCLKKRVPKAPSLKIILLRRPLLVIAGTFLLLFLGFNLAVTRLVNIQTRSAIQSQFNRLDVLYRSEKAKLEVEALVGTSYLILDQQFKPVYVSESLSHQEDEELIEALSDFVERRQHFWTIDKADDATDDESVVLDRQTQHRLNKRSGLVRVDGESYTIRLQKYFGKLAGDHINRTQRYRAQTYYVIAFANVTPIQDWLIGVNMVLGILLLLSALTLLAFIWSIARKTQKDFQKLSYYLMAIGERIEEREEPMLRYQEFQALGQAATRMDNLISRHQESQKIFFQNASHELRTPLTSIKGYAEGLKAGLITDSSSAAETIYQESQKMSHLIDDILTLSRLEVQGDNLMLERFAIKDFLYDLSWRFEHQIKSANLSLLHDFPADHVDIIADEDLLDRALSTIMSNAIRYAERTISISYASSPPHLKISIANDGPPIIQKDLPYIFDRFYKGESGHFGIGLAMAKEIVSQHGGDIRVLSNQKETRFTIYLPQ
ncbi:sensor histidine kinase [Streptococcus halotolerans]|uniref:sensor histidine kinase n=1 Tax=Streptococcus halotolerans TaxID=1814128 RepID=UPI0009ECCEB3|nr:HAMP domain-containing sensor histidine kinase [Streptococcus halotolerans]